MEPLQSLEKPLYINVHLHFLCKYSGHHNLAICSHCTITFSVPDIM